MSNLYFSSSNFNIVLSMLLFIEIAVQTYILVKKVPIKIEYIRKIAFLHELCILMYIIIAFLQVTFIQSSIGIIVDEVFIIVKYTFIILIIITSFYNIFIEYDMRNFYMELLNSMLIFYIMLFLSDKISRNEFYYVAIILLYFRNYLKIYQLNKLRNSNITVYSIKEAMDTLNVGLLFSDSRGNINLINDKMKELLSIIFVKNYRDFLKLEKDLKCFKNTDQIKCIELDESYVFRLGHLESWLFKKEKIIVRDKVYIQFAAFDISELDSATIKLECIQDKLINNKKKLEEILNNLEEVKTTEELIRVKTIVHDAMGQRVSALQRVMVDGNFKDYNSLMILTSGLMNDIRKDMNEPAIDRLTNMIQAFEEIGVKIYIEGGLPENEEIKFLFIDIIREGIINAVRHGLAANINIIMDKKENMCYLEISNDGKIPKKNIMEGYGISNIRKKVDSLNGEFQIKYIPKFSIEVKIGGDK